MGVFQTLIGYLQVVLFVALFAAFAGQLRNQTIRAIFKRNVTSYFSSVLGYIFVITFVVAGAFLAFNTQFFANNLANFDQLSDQYPVLMLFLIPAITMTAWADEKKLGTDELLFTLPATDFQVLIGKYLAVLAVYTIALLFSLTHLAVLEWIGNPDWGMVLCTYFGYWLVGASLLSCGMFASVLTNSTTVAFVLGVVVSAIPIFIGNIAPSNSFFRFLSLNEQFRDFAMGMVSLSSVAYFTSLIVFMLYLNYVFITKRHWASDHTNNMGMQFVVRGISLAAILISVNYLASQATLRADSTAEKLYSLSSTTEELISKVDKKRPVTIQAFVSREVPREYVPTRKRLIGLLRQYDQQGGSNIDVRIVDVDPFSDEAEQAKVLGITPQNVVSERDGRRFDEEIYLGALVTSSYDEVAIPFFGSGTLAEYELTRSLRTVSKEKRPTIGVLTTDAQIIGAGQGEWRIVAELRKQYEVKEISPDSDIKADEIDALLAVMPSSLTQPQMTNLVDYVKAGHPALIFDDPLPMAFRSMFGVVTAPRLPKPSPGGGMMGMGRQQQAPPKADGGKATSLLRVLDLKWEYDQIVWDRYNPHPQFGEIPPEYLFIKPRREIPSAFNPNSQITSGLQEMLAAYAGTIVARNSNDDLQFVPLLKTGPTSGILEWDDFTEQSFDMSRMAPAVRISPTPDRSLDEYAHVLAGHITSKKKDSPLNVIFVADIDMISDWFFLQREQADISQERGAPSMNFDNVTFILNAVDVLADDTSFIDLRKRRLKLRTLQRVEQATSVAEKNRVEAQENATNEANKALEAAKKRFADQIEEINENTQMDEREKQIRVKNIQANEERQLEVAKANIDREKGEKIREIKSKTEREVRKIENRIRWIAVLIPPIPALLLGLYVLLSRLANERRNISSDRLIHRG